MFTVENFVELAISADQNIAIYSLEKSREVYRGEADLYNDDLAPYLPEEVQSWDVADDRLTLNI